MPEVAKAGIDITAWATVALAVLTAILALLTWVLAREARKTREQDLEPNIVVTIEPYEVVPSLACLIIENVGKGVAYNVSIKEKAGHDFIPLDMSPPPKRKTFKLNDLSLMNLKVLKAGQKIEHCFSTFNNLPSKTFEFEIVAEDSIGRKIPSSNIVDVNYLYERLMFDRKNIKDVAESLEKIQRSLDQLTSGRIRIKVDTYDQENRDAEYKEWLEANEARKVQGS